MSNTVDDYVFSDTEISVSDEEISLEHLASLFVDQDDEEEHWWDELEMQAVAVTRVAMTERKTKWKHQRLNWNEHKEKKVHEGTFDQKYQMSVEAFDNLVELLRPMITQDQIKARNSCGEPINPELVVAMGLCWLAGGSYHDIMDTFSVSQSSFYRARDIFLDAVIACDALKIRFPETPSELENVRKRFAAKSTNKVIRGCVGAIDGLLARINQPSTAECEGNPRSYHSGHYNDYGLNVQAICDSRLHFLFFAVASPGSQGDLVAYEGLSIHEIIEKLPDSIYIIGDAAYRLSEHILVPFTGADRQAADKDTFNYFLSQLWIRIEMTFELLTTKWRILRKHLETKLTNSSKILEACARLHNFVIDQDSEDDFEEDDEDDEGDDVVHYQTILDSISMNGSPLGWAYLPTIEPLVAIEGTSRTRDAILTHISRNGYRRPAENVERRLQELHELQPPLM